MKSIEQVGLLLLLGWNVACATSVASELLPGLTYYGSCGEVTGKFVFLVSQDAHAETNSETAASIYEFDLSQRKLQKLTATPNGSFIAPIAGDTFCVLYRPGYWFRSDDTNVFVYSTLLRRSRILGLPSAPKEIVALDGHILVVLEQTNGTRLLDYEIARDQRRTVELAGASNWQYHDYERIHVPRSGTNILHFYYNGHGRRLEDGRDYRDGFYSLSIETGDIRWFAELLEDNDDERNAHQAFGGRYIFFEGGSGPITGRTLVSSPWVFGETRNRDPKGEKVKVLKRFSRASEGA